MKIKTLQDLETIKNAFREQEKEFLYTAHICYAAGCISSDCREVKDAFIEALEREKLSHKVKIKLTGCMGACGLGPTLIINPGRTLYCKLTPDDMQFIVREHIRKGRIVERFCFMEKETGRIIPDLNEIEFFRSQKKIVLQNCGINDFASIDEYIAHDGYFALNKVLKNMTRDAVIDEIKRSGLRGRGGGGFPTGIKWGMANKTQASQKYIICNADKVIRVHLWTAVCLKAMPIWS